MLGVSAYSSVAAIGVGVEDYVVVYKDGSMSTVAMGTIGVSSVEDSSATVVDPRVGSGTGGIGVVACSASYD